MLLLEGTQTEVTANVTGPIDEYVTPEVTSVIDTSSGNFLSWRKDRPTNTLNKFIAGNKYLVVVSADSDIKTLSDANDGSRANMQELVFRVETTDDTPGDMPGVLLQSGSFSMISIKVSGKDSGAFFAAANINVSVSCDETGVVNVEDTGNLYTFGNVAITFSSDTNYLIPQVQNTTPSASGVNKWAVYISVIEVVHYIAP